MRLEDIKKSITNMSTSELMDLVEDIRKKRQTTKHVKADAAPKPGGGNKTKKLKSILNALSPEEKAAIMGELEGGA